MDGLAKAVVAVFALVSWVAGWAFPDLWVSLVGMHDAKSAIEMWMIGGVVILPVFWTLILTYRCDWCHLRVLRPVKFRNHGGAVCSLRCVNAYEASKGIKESRERIVLADGHRGD